MEDHYSLLGVTQSATKAQIRSAYLRLIRQYHPDHNPSPAAAEVTQRLNEAYSVLSDDQQRPHYDTWLKSQQQPAPQSAESSPAANEPVPDIKCSRCGRQEQSLRLTLMYYAVSLLVVTHRRGASGIWCERCRAIEAAKWSVVSGLAGWWGIPWGPIYTVHALILNALGGKQPCSENASILRVLGYQLYSKGRYSDAAGALARSIALEPNQKAQELLSYLQQQPTPQKRWSKWSIFVPIPSLIVVAFWAFVLVHVVSSPSGYAANYQPPPTVDVQPAPARADAARESVNALVGSLADTVEARAPIVGSHYEGTTRIQDHVLDRSKFDSSEIRDIEGKIRATMQGKPDPDGFMASALFNAEVLAVSIEVVNGVHNGADVSREFDELENIQTDPLISDWLGKSRYWVPYTQLCAKLERYRRLYRPGISTGVVEQDYQEHKATLQQMKAQLDRYETADDSSAYNSLVPEYNAQVGEINALSRRLRNQSTIAQKLDLAFNKCLDTSILMSRFQQVNLSSHEGEISTLPDPQ